MTAQVARMDAPHITPAPRARNDAGSVLQALRSLTPPPVRQSPPPPPGPRPPSAAFVPARRPERRPAPGTGVVDVRALATRAAEPVVARPGPAILRPSPTVIVAHSLLHAVKPRADVPPPRPVPPPPTVPEPARPRMSPLFAFMFGALLGTGLLTVSLIAQST